MNDPAFKTAAYAIAEAAPRHLDQPTTPPIRWRLDGANLVVILADGRIATGPIVDQYRDKVASVKKQAIVPGSSTGAIVPGSSVVVPVPARGTGVEAPAASLPANVVVPVLVREVVVPVPKRDPPAKKKAVRIK